MRFTHWIQSFFSSIRRRLLAFSLATVGLLGLVSVYSQVNAEGILRGVKQVYERQNLLIDLVNTSERISASLEAYLASKGSESLLRLIRDSEILDQELEGVLNWPVLSGQGGGSRRNIFGLGREFQAEVQRAVTAKRGRDEEGYSTAYELTQRLSGYLKAEVDQFGLEEFRASLRQANLFYEKLGALQVSNMIALTSLLILALLLSFWFSRELADPLERLSVAATEISRGNYDFELPPAGSDETGRLAAAFDRMRGAIVRSIEEIRHAAEVENENLRMRSLLRNTEYQALQAQINPHFLFNTLNAASQLAMMEEALETEKFLHRLAHLMRHNIRKLDQPVTLAEEIQNLENYIYIMTIRFGARVRFDLVVDAPVEGVTIPPMSLQPLVENCLVHGLRDREEGGIVSILLSSVSDFLLVEIRDNGVGLQPSVLQSLQDDTIGEESTPISDSLGHSNGIGLGNVLHRLRLFYGVHDVIRISSSPGAGTSVVLRLPLTQGGPHG